MEKKNHPHACQKPWQFHLHLPRCSSRPQPFGKVFENRFCCRGVPKFPGVAQNIFKKSWARKHWKKKSPTCLPESMAISPAIARVLAGPHQFGKVFENPFCCKGAPQFPKVAHKILKKLWARKHGTKKSPTCLQEAMALWPAFAKVFVKAPAL